MLIGFDVGGTKIEAAALAEDGETLARERVATPRRDYAGGVRAIADLVAGLESRLGPAQGVGLGVPGSLSPTTGLMRNANSTWLNGKPLKRDLEAALGREVRLENDANCLAVSEAVDGAGAGARVAFAVILGTGCGGGVAIDGRAVGGRNAIAGEFGHNPLPWAAGAAEQPGPPCWCGRRGCIETFLSGPGFARLHNPGGAPLTAEEIVTAARDGDGAAKASLEIYADRLARSLASVANLLDPDVFVLGGGMSNVGELYDGLSERIAAYVFSDAFSTPVRPAAHGDSSGVRGAAWLWRR
ncbi:ROK family protein [Hansschlegelia plantiphila]|uniref:Fructokinase n=1 Tax=Hansschlegelia plantiphila TaxID=374655 RepID=A0A9W6J228_9HYPH|nr:ROK family protein [Hansschlegelia plantiphila]GLK68361.1 fructokinase [Hansschlegelia plantiphila]